MTPHPPPTSPLKTFPLFPLLPLELQTLIWRHTLATPLLIHPRPTTIRTSDLALISRRISYDKEFALSRPAAYHFTSKAPVLLHVSRHTRDLALRSFGYQRCFTLTDDREGQGIGYKRLWYQALMSFWGEWERSSDPEVRGFFEREKEIFDLAREYVSKQTGSDGGLVMKTSDPWKRRSENEKSRLFAESVGVFYRVKTWMEKFESGAGGVWLRPSVQTVYLDRDEMEFIKCWSGWQAEGVRSVAVDELNIERAGDEVWAALFGQRRKREEMGDKEEVIRKPLFPGLEELCIVVSHGYHGYRRGKTMCFYDEEEVERKKQGCHDRMVIKLRKESTLVKIPKVTVVRDNELDRLRALFSR